jgi:hypothetical protein
MHVLIIFLYKDLPPSPNHILKEESTALTAFYLARRLILPGWVSGYGICNALTDIQILSAIGKGVLLVGTSSSNFFIPGLIGQCCKRDNSFNS